MNRVAALLAVVLCACPPPAPKGPSLTAGDARLEFAADGGSVALVRGPKTLLRFEPSSFQAGTVRALDDTRSYDPYWLLVDAGTLPAETPPGFRWREAASAVATQVSPQEVELALTLQGDLPATVRFRAEADHFSAVFIATPTDANTAVAFLRLRARADAQEGFYGLGEWFDAINHRGKLRPMQLEANLEVESLYNEAHAPVPLLIGSRGWGLFVASHRPGVFDVARSGDDVVDTVWGTAEASGLGLTFHLFAPASGLDVLLPYFRLAGFPELPAPWALGPWIWRDENRDQAEVEDDLVQIRALDLATSGVWIDRPYATEVNTFDFLPAQFPDPAGLVATAHAAGFRLALWHTPYLASGAQPQRAQADAQAWFPPERGPQLNGWSPPLDFTHAGAEDFWVQQLGAYVSLGFEGFKLDYGEDIIPGLSGRRAGWTFADGSTDRTMHHRYTLLYHRAYRRALGGEPGFLLARAGKWGDQMNGTVIWPGDLDARLVDFGQTVTEGTRTYVAVGGLSAAVRGGVGLSMSGFPFFGADTGGYRHSPPDRETWLRWVEQSALGTVMQTGDSSSQPPWVFTPENGRDAAALEVYRQFARLHLRLFPFFWTHAQAIATTGRPVLRPFGLAFPELGLHPADVYLVGDDLLVAPVVGPGQTTRAFPVPPGAWVNWFDGARLTAAAGGEVTVPAPVDVLPLYLRAGALVPMLRPNIDTLAPASLAGVESFANDPGALYVRTARGDEGTNRFTVYDGAVLQQQVTGPLLSLSANPGTVFTGTVVFEVIAEARPTAVTRDGAALSEAADLPALLAAPSGWCHTGAAGGTVFIKTALPSGALDVVR